MDTGTLDMFHDTWNIHMLTITDSINFHLFTNDIFIYQDWGIMTDFLYRSCHVYLQVIIVMHDFHGTAT